MLAWILSPLGKLAAVAVATLAIVAAVFRKGATSERDKIEARAQRDALWRTQNAVRAGDDVDVSADGLRNDDGYRRD